MQLCHGYDQVNFPFVLATDFQKAQVFLVNVNTGKRVPLINMKIVHIFDAITDIQQTSKFQDPTKDKLYNNLQEITLHFKMSQYNKDGIDGKLFYCQLKLSREAIQMLVETKGAIANSYMHAYKDILRLTNEIDQLRNITKDYSHVKKIIDENEFVKKLAKDKERQIAKLANEHEEEIKKLKNEMEVVQKTL